MRYPDYYVLKVPRRVSTSGGSRQVPASVAVQEFRAHQYLRRGLIVYRPKSEQIAFYNYHHWAEDPRQSVTTAMLRELQQVFQSAELYERRTDAEFRVTGSLDRLEEVDSERSVWVEVGISAKLHDVKTGKVMGSDTSFKTSEVNQRSLPAVVAEVSRDLIEDATHLVSSMRSQVSPSSFRATND